MSRDACYSSDMDPKELGKPDPSLDAPDRFAAMSPEARLSLFLELCDLTDSIQQGLPRRAALRAEHPRSDEAIALWARLMRRNRP